jgi:hypothetical protein
MGKKTTIPPKNKINWRVIIIGFVKLIGLGGFAFVVATFESIIREGPTMTIQTIIKELGNFGIYKLAGVLAVAIIYIGYILITNITGDESKKHSKLRIIVVIITILIAILLAGSSGVGIDFIIRNNIIPSATPSSTSTPTATFTLTFTQTFTSTRTPTKTIESTPTSIYDPIISIIYMYFDNIPNSENATINYDLAWPMLDSTLQGNYKCNTCKNAKGGWIWYVSQYYFNINPEELRKSGNIDISDSYAKADIKLEKIEIKSGRIVYSDLMSICLFKRPEGWRITYINEGKLPETDDCIQ